ncbi:MAG TPA: polysaccharide deacetylase family protein [Burkholderiales bacterium]|nr:polysaccharide deacetylase family protein [Burkholderiales bacterium]
MKRAFVLIPFLLSSMAGAVDVQPVELHQELSLPAGGTDKVVALTLDACGGGFDAELANFLIEHRIQATIFATRRWIRRNPDGLALLTAHADLFEIEDHGANHVPAIIGVDRSVYGLAGVADLKQLRREVSGGADAVKTATGIAPHWYRGATGEYDPEALKTIEAMGYKVAGFSINADNGATLEKRRIVARLMKVRSGDIIIAHLNKPASDTGEGMAEGLQLLLDRGYRFVKLNGSVVRPPQKRS